MSKIKAVVDKREDAFLTLIFMGYDKPVTLPANFLPKARESDVVEVTFSVRKREGKKEKAKTAELIRRLQES